MGRELAEEFPAARTVFDEVSTATGIDARKLCWDSDEETLRQAGLSTGKPDI